MRAARILVTPDLLRAVFGLPDTTNILYAGMDREHGGLFIEFGVTDPELQEVGENIVPPVVTPVVSRDEYGQLHFVRWGQP